MELGVTSAVSLTNPDIGDLALTDAGHEVVVTELAAEVEQRLRVRLNFFRGEWFLNLDAGTPYFQAILVKDPKDRVVRAVFNDLITQTPGVAELLSFSYSISRLRQMSVTFKCSLDDGTVFTTTSFPPFVIQL